jgi:hypothetical protein
VVGADAIALEDMIRKANAEELAVLLRDYVASLT